MRQSDIGGVIVQRRLLGNDYVERLSDALPELNESGPDLRVFRTPFQERGQLVVAALVTRKEIPMLPSNKVSRRRLERILADKLGR